MLEASRGAVWMLTMVASLLACGTRSLAGEESDSSSDVVAWIEQLKSDDWRVRRDARRALVERADQAEPALRKVVPWTPIDIGLSDVDYSLPALTVLGSVGEGE